MEVVDLKNGVILFAAGTAASTGFRLLFAVLGISGYEAVERELLAGNIWKQVLELCVVAPVLEELVFRKLIYTWLKRKSSVRPAMVFSSILFGLYHGKLSQGIYGFVMGLFLAWVMEKFETVKAPVAVHMGANAAAVIIGNILP